MTEVTEQPGPSGPARYVPDDMVVASADREIVEFGLGQLGTPLEPATTEEDRTLGLVLLKGLRPTTLAPGGQPAVDVDRVLADLRAVFRPKYGGWLPQMGKNREVASVVALPGGGGSRTQAVGDPDAATAAQAPPPATGTAGSAARVGVLDAPLYPHPRLVGHVPEGTLLAELLELRSHDPQWRPWEGHATFVADLILREAPAAALAFRRVALQGVGTGTVWDMARAMAGSAGTGIDILNVSLGCTTDDGEPPFVLSRAVQRLAPQMLIVAAAGNHGNDEPLRSTPVWPAALPDVVAVGATDADFSPDLPWVTCTAPGTDVVGAYLTETVTLAAASGTGPARQRRFDGYAAWKGTSFAAATASGAIAAAMAPGMSAQEALLALLARPDGVLRRFPFKPM